MADRRRDDDDRMPEVLRPIEFRGGGFAVRPPGVGVVVAVIVVIAVWEAASRLGWVDPKLLPSPLTVLGTLGELMVDGELGRHAVASLERLAIGWSIGTGAGLMAGLAIGLWSLARAIGLPVVSALFPIPAVALMPLLYQWLGIGETAIVATIAFGAFLPNAIAVYDGVEAVPRNLIRMGQSFGLPRRLIVWTIVLPGARPAILSGFRNSAAIALILLVAAEMIGANRGVGWFILAAGDHQTVDQLMAGLLVLAVLGVTIGLLLSMLERWLLRWR